MCTARQGCVYEHDTRGARQSIDAEWSPAEHLRHITPRLIEPWSSPQRHGSTHNTGGSGSGVWVRSSISSRSTLPPLGMRIRTVQLHQFRIGYGELSESAIHADPKPRKDQNSGLLYPLPARKMYRDFGKELLLLHRPTRCARH